MNKFLSFFLLLVSFSGLAQTPIDTVETDKGKMVIYSNRTWKFLLDEEFDGIMNEALFNIIQADTNLNLVQTWDNNVCFTSERTNDLSRMNDTLWLCLVDDLHKEYVQPVPGIVTSRYGYRKGRYHNGIDLNLHAGDTVKAAFSGRVRYAKWNDGGFGNLVIIRHYNGLETFYAHLSKHLVAPDQEVKAGDPIGLGGNTGHSFGAHLHFEVRFYDASMNPEEVIDFAKKELKDENLMVHKRLFRPGAKPSDEEISGESIAAVQARTEAVAARKYYKIRTGDTLSQIASKSNTTVSTLCKLNGIRPTTLLQVGRQVRVR
ncbi:M23 family metallopeptidase [Fluviicola sp.]|jgi:murein DD-endopeptidase MepM/ murein hydrolase activator NlpD|uniref:M23 family metallopeptidase n=1 Tax=Fluviicola sp. TaxID=1917219 RepID=UPI00282DC701|nr:M23 family metallopeptidase [Fluviicola sp.]MDR0801233.1 peptidoglycan DD-metalloendopeptidase family protein [Fluviicola sp.]